MEIWEIGVLLIGIGFVLVSIYLIIVLTQLKRTIEQTNDIIRRNEREIEDIISSLAGISVAIDSTIYSSSSKLKTVGTVVDALGRINSIRKRRNIGRD